MLVSYFSFRMYLISVLGSVTWAAERGEVKLVNISFKPCEGVIEGEPIISWLHNVCVPVTVSL
jgi:hypothetical protein